MRRRGVRTRAGARGCRTAAHIRDAHGVNVRQHVAGCDAALAVRVLHERVEKVGGGDQELRQGAGVTEGPGTATAPQPRTFPGWSSMATTEQSIPGVSFGLTLSPMLVRYDSNFSWGTLQPQPLSCATRASGSAPAGSGRKRHGATLQRRGVRCCNRGGRTPGLGRGLPDGSAAAPRAPAAAARARLSGVSGRV